MTQRQNIYFYHKEEPEIIQNFIHYAIWQVKMDSQW